MKSSLSKGLLWAVTFVFFTILCSFSSQAAEKKKVTFTKKMKQLISRADVYIGDVPKHRITQWVRTDSHTYSDPDFGSAEEWIYMHSDSVAGTGAFCHYL